MITSPQRISIMIKKLRAFVLLPILINAGQITTSCTALLNKTVNHICYVGSLDLNIKQKEPISLYYDGTIIKANNGIYSFKEHQSVGTLYFLFINPEAICFRTNHNDMGSYLTFDDHASYEFYRIKPTTSTNLENELFVDWNIKQKPMPKQLKNDSLQVVIPEHTIIIPLDAQYFNHEDGKITFTYTPLTARHAIVKLPAPQCNRSTQHEKLIESLLKANLCIMNLKNIHAPQEIKKIKLDNHTIQETL